MSNIESICSFCQGTGVDENVSGEGDSHVCGHCEGDGKITCDDIPALDDILDKVNEILVGVNILVEDLNP